MSKHQTADIRNIALAGHRASGKTSLADALLFKAKAVDRRGSVDDGTSVSDFDEEEHEHQFLHRHQRPAPRLQGQARQPLDTPGYPDFVGAALGALGAVENVVVVVSAVNGVEVNTRRMFTEAGKRGLARMLVINKLDGDNVNFDELLKIDPRHLRQGLRAVQRPDQPRPQVQRRRQRAESARDAAGRLPGRPGRRPLAAGGRHRRGRRGADGKVPDGRRRVTRDELTAALPKALAAGTVIPIFCTAARRTRTSASPSCSTRLATYALSPLQAPPKQGRQGHRATRPQEIELKPDPAGEFVGQVFKAVTDKFVGNLSFLRVFSGTYKADQPLVNGRTEQVGPHRRPVRRAGQQDRRR